MSFNRTRILKLSYITIKWCDYLVLYILYPGGEDVHPTTCFEQLATIFTMVD